MQNHSRSINQQINSNNNSNNSENTMQQHEHNAQKFAFGTALWDLAKPEVTSSSSSSSNSSSNSNGV